MTRYGCSIAHQLAIGIVLLSIASQLPVGIQAQQSVTLQEPQLVFNELHGSGQPDFYYGQQPLLKQELQQQHPRPKPLSVVYLANQLPSLRDLILSTDYDSQLALDSLERERASQGSHLLARLHRLSENSIDDDYEQQRQPQQQMKFIGLKHSSKRNAQYMMPCHFKICNMGR